MKHSQSKFPDTIFCLQNFCDDVSTFDKRIKGKDYYVLSGTFNTIGKNSKASWERFIFKIILNMFILCRKGIGFNLLSTYADHPLKGLYHVDPRIVYDWCKRKLSRFVTLVEDRPLYEFTMFAYKEDFVKSLYSRPFAKYFRN